MTECAYCRRRCSCMGALMQHMNDAHPLRPQSTDSEVER